ncbi:MAG: cyclase family protein [Microvirga sp.]|jgi:arylformamidase|nr:cyclase family protein [Microvirga sp.]
MRIVDLTMPIGPHFRWSPDIQIKGDIGAGDPFRITRLSTTCHGFTHVDAMAHFVANGPTIESTPLDRVVGPCRILDLRDVEPNTAIGAERLAAADPGGPAGEILLLSAGWDRKRDYRTDAFWREAPFVTREGAEWLLARRPSAVAVDFPQDYTIRLLLDGVVAPRPEHVTHDVLLSAGVTLIEYLVNTSALVGPRTFLCAAPLLVPTADGAPTRAFAIEGLAS